MLPNVGGGELVIVLLILLLLFGAKRIPELAKGLGAGIREFRKGVSGEKDEVRERGKEESKPLRGETLHDTGLHSGSDQAEEEDNRAQRKP
jgi:sec-independent protein translocase protein TatA